MKKIDVKVLKNDCDGTPLFLAKLTQRGHLLKDMSDVLALYNDCQCKTPSEYLLALPHTTIKRMNYITVAVTGLSTKAVSQLRTHAKRLSFISTSTQYSSFENNRLPYLIPDVPEQFKDKITNALQTMHDAYTELINAGLDKDDASYLIPQSLRKVVIISGSIDEWAYVMRTRLCNRNTKEVRYIMSLLYDEIAKTCGEIYLTNALPNCVNGKCLEGKFCCGKKFTFVKELENEV